MALNSNDEKNEFNSSKKVRKKKKIKELSTIIGVISGILTILITLPDLIELYNKHDSYPSEKEIKLFVENYGKAYTEVVNTYVQGNEAIYTNENGKYRDPLDDYISTTKGGRDFKEVIINHIKDNRQDNKNNDNNKEFSPENIYEFKFNYDYYKSSKETGDSDSIFVSGVSETIINKSNSEDVEKKGNNGVRRRYDVIIDKNSKNIKIENRIFY